MRIGMICPYSLSVPGGVQHQVLSLAESLVARGHDVRVLAPCDGPPPVAYVTPIGNSLPTSANGSVAPLAPDVASALRTIRSLRDERFDVVHLHEPLAPGPTLTALTLHAQPTVGTFHAAGRSTSYRYLGPVLRRLLNRLDVSVAVSADAAELVREHLHFDVDHVLFNGVRVADHSSGGAPGIRQGLVFIGRHEERKGLHVLVDAMRLLEQRAHRPVLRIVGDGPATRDLQAATASMDWIHWCGRVSDVERDAAIEMAQVLVAPSLGGESFGIVLAEAMAHGAAVVASDLPGYRNVATHESDAILVPPADATALADALERLITDDALRERVASAGRRRAAELSMDRLSKAYEELYSRADTRHRN